MDTRMVEQTKRPAFPRGALQRTIVLAALAAAFLCVTLFLQACASSAQGKSCTLLVYLCGSNLETKHGYAGKNIDELLAANIPPNTKVVIQTGGSTTWHSHDIPSNKLCRYEVRNKQLVKVEELPNASMGNPATLTEFLTWSQENYESDRTMLVLWDHGGQSASALCFDENYNMESIDHDEMDQAFRSANLSKKLNLIVLDACFMASLENASVLDSYADYLVASQEIVPSAGLDYKAIASEFSARDDLEFGKFICDSFMAKCKAAGKGDRVEMTLLDLSQTKNMLKEFDVFCGYLDGLLNNRDGIMTVANASRGSALYGAKDVVNLIDLLSFTSGAHYETSEDFSPLLETHQKFVAHEVLGLNREGFGVSVYYPLRYNKNRLKYYLQTCPSKPYEKLLSKIYFNEPEVTVALKDPGSTDKSGRFAIQLAEGSERYVRSITFTLWKEEQGASGGLVKLGEGFNIHQDWDNLVFSSEFKGLWPSLEKHTLYTEIELTSAYSVVFSMPVQANGEKTAITTYYLFDADSYEAGFFTHEFLWGGVNEDGIPERDFKDLNAGDKVRVYAAADESGRDLRPQDEFVFAGTAADDESNVSYEPLPDGRYRLQMTVTDLFGNQFASNYAYYNVHNGTASLSS